MEIHAVLAAHACVDLGEQSGRDKAEGETPEVSRGGKAGDVADYTAPDRYDHGCPVYLKAEKAS